MLMMRAVCGVAHLSSTSYLISLSFVSNSHHSLQQLKDDDIQPLCAILGRFKNLKTIDLVSRGM